MAVNNITNPNPAVAGVTTPLTSETAKSDRAAAAKIAASNYAKTAEKRPPMVSEAANVQISQKARELNQAKKIVEDTPDIREDKVAKFKSMIASGEYKAEPSKIADGILKEAIREEMSKNPEAAYE